MVQVNWMAVTTVVAIGALLTTLLTYLVATVGRPAAARRTGADARHDSVETHDWSRAEPAERRPAA
ncbi:MAG TPA: hypothetical protein VE465_24235 [Streptosporangiaceae bacterium]|jgi:hypothetical protein|nr:hypothetical protein [Streptosporangiaceae bacterium]